jgi:splicing factor 3B subunit 1
LNLIFQLRKKIQEKAKDGTLKVSNGEPQPKKRGRWDQTIDDQFVPAKKTAAGAATPTWGDTDVSIF